VRWRCLAVALVKVVHVFSVHPVVVIMKSYYAVDTPRFSFGLASLIGLFSGEREREVLSVSNHDLS